MQNSYRNHFIGIALLVLVVAAVLIFYRSYSAPLSGTNSNATSTAATTANTVATTGGEVHIKQLQEFVAEARAQKNVGNYSGAIATLLQAKQMFPGDIVVNNNLGDLYMNFQKDYVKAEAAYKTVIATNPNYLDSYRHLFELYTTTSYKPTNTAAADIVAAAIKANPNAYDMQLLLARWYKSTNNPSIAKVQYEAALANAKRQNLTSVAAQIEEELQTLSQ